MLLLDRATGWTVNGSVVLNGIAAVLTMAEAALKYSQLTGVSISRKGAFAKAPVEAIREFLESQGTTHNSVE